MKTYYMRFGSGDPRTYTGLAPTFLIFNNAGSAVTAPSIAEVTGATGIYSFQFGTTTPICFLADAATTSPGTTGRYVSGSIDPADRADEYGTTLVAIGTSLTALGVTAVSWGSANSTALTNQGTTLVAIGNTSIALGTTSVALGTTNVALGTTNVALGTTSVSWGSANSTALTNQGSTLVGIGNTSIALGTTNVALGTTNIAIGVTAVSWGLANSTALTNQGTTLVAIGNTSIALGNTILFDVVGLGSTLADIGSSLLILIGSTASSYGTSATDPGDLFGYLKRIQENLEGNETFVKLTGALTIKSRTSTTLASKTVANSVSMVTKS